jgi:hypothetical protein
MSILALLNSWKFLACELSWELGTWSNARILKKKNPVWFMLFNATFNNISVISWRSVLLVEETGVPEENL